MNGLNAAALAATVMLGACATASPPAMSAAPSGAHQVVDGAAKARIDSTLRAFVTAGNIAGASALIYEKGSEVYFNAVGMADRDTRHWATSMSITPIRCFAATSPAAFSGPSGAKRSGRVSRTSVLSGSTLADAAIRRAGLPSGSLIADGRFTDNAPVSVSRYRQNASLCTLRLIFTTDNTFCNTSSSSTYRYTTMSSVMKLTRSPVLRSGRRLDRSMCLLCDR